MLRSRPTPRHRVGDDLTACALELRRTTGMPAAHHVPVIYDRRMIAMCLLVLTLQTSPAAATAAGAVPADARAAIERANSDWLPAMKRQDAQAIAEVYADDGVFVLPNGDSVKGRAAIEQLMRDRFSRTDPVVGGTLTQDNLVAAGSMIYEWGHAEIAMGGRGTQSASRVSARYLTVWQRDASGRWRIIRNLSLGN